MLSPQRVQVQFLLGGIKILQDLWHGQNLKRPEILNFCPPDIKGWNILCCEELLHRQMFSSISDFYPLDASSTPKPYSQLWQPKLSSDYQLPSLGAGGQNHSHMRIIDLASLSFSALNYNPKTIIIKMSTSSGSEGWWDTCILMWHRAWHTVRWSINITCCYYYSINQGIEICVTAPLAYQILSWKFNSANKYWRSISTGILPATGNHRLNKI